MSLFRSLSGLISSAISGDSASTSSSSPPPAQRKEHAPSTGSPDTSASRRTPNTKQSPAPRSSSSMSSSGRASTEEESAAEEAAAAPVEVPPTTPCSTTSDAPATPVSSATSRIGAGDPVSGSRRTSVSSAASSSFDLPEVDLSHLSEDERLLIESVLARARYMEEQGTVDELSNRSSMTDEDVFGEIPSTLDDDHHVDNDNVTNNFRFAVDSDRRSDTSDVTHCLTSDGGVDKRNGRARPVNLTLVGPAAGDTNSSAASIEEAPIIAMGARPSGQITRSAQQRISRDGDVISSSSHINNASQSAPSSTSSFTSSHASLSKHTDRNQSPTARRSPLTPPRSPPWALRGGAGAAHRSSPPRVASGRRSPHGGSPIDSATEKHPVNSLEDERDMFVFADEVTDDIIAALSLTRAADGSSNIAESRKMDRKNAVAKSDGRDEASLASYAATIASVTAHMTSMNVSPPEREGGGVGGATDQGGQRESTRGSGGDPGTKNDDDFALPSWVEDIFKSSSVSSADFISNTRNKLHVSSATTAGDAYQKPSSTFAFFDDDVTTMSMTSPTHRSAVPSTTRALSETFELPTVGGIVAGGGGGGRPRAAQSAKLVPTPTDWSPINDLSPILDVSPSMESFAQNEASTTASSRNGKETKRREQAQVKETAEEQSMNEKRGDDLAVTPGPNQPASPSRQLVLGVGSSRSPSDASGIIRTSSAASSDSNRNSRTRVEVDEHNFLCETGDGATGTGASRCDTMPERGASRRPVLISSKSGSREEIQVSRRKQDARDSTMYTEQEITPVASAQKTRTSGAPISRHYAAILDDDNEDASQVTHASHKMSLTPPGARSSVVRPSYRERSASAGDARSSSPTSTSSAQLRTQSSLPSTMGRPSRPPKPPVPVGKPKRPPADASAGGHEATAQSRRQISTATSNTTLTDTNPVSFVSKTAIVLSSSPAHPLPVDQSMQQTATPRLRVQLSPKKIEGSSGIGRPTSETTKPAVAPKPKPSPKPTNAVRDSRTAQQRTAPPRGKFVEPLPSRNEMLSEPRLSSPANTIGRGGVVNVYGVEVPDHVHALYQRIKDELKILTAARRLHLDEIEAVRIMEAELAARMRRRLFTDDVSRMGQAQRLADRARATVARDGVHSISQGGSRDAARSQDPRAAARFGAQQQRERTRMMQEERTHSPLQVRRRDASNSASASPALNRYSPQPAHRTLPRHQDYTTQQQPNQEFSRRFIPPSAAGDYYTTQDTPDNRMYRTLSSRSPSASGLRFDADSGSHRLQPFSGRLGGARSMQQLDDASSPAPNPSHHESFLYHSSTALEDYNYALEDVGRGTIDRRHRNNSRSVSSLPMYDGEDVMGWGAHGYDAVDQWGRKVGDYVSNNAGDLGKVQRLRMLQGEIEKRRRHLTEGLPSMQQQQWEQQDQEQLLLEQQEQWHRQQQFESQGQFEEWLRPDQQHQRKMWQTQMADAASRQLRHQQQDRRQTMAPSSDFIVPLEYQQINAQNYYVRGDSNYSATTMISTGSDQNGVLSSSAYQFDQVSSQSDAQRRHWRTVSEPTGVPPTGPYSLAPGRDILARRTPTVDFDMSSTTPGLRYGSEETARPHSQIGLHHPPTVFQSSTSDALSMTSGFVSSELDDMRRLLGSGDVNINSSSGISPSELMYGTSLTVVRERPFEAAVPYPPVGQRTGSGGGVIIPEYAQPPGAFTPSSLSPSTLSSITGGRGCVVGHGDDVQGRSSRARLRDGGSGGRPLSDDADSIVQGKSKSSSRDSYMDMLSREDGSQHSIAESRESARQDPGHRRTPSSVGSTNVIRKYSSLETRKFLLTPEAKDKSQKGNNIGLKIIGGRLGGWPLPWPANELGAYVAAIYPGTAADQLHGQLHEGDQVLEWNGEPLTGKSFEEVRALIEKPTCEVELVIRPASDPNTNQLLDREQSNDSILKSDTSTHSFYDNITPITADQPTSTTKPNAIKIDGKIESSRSVDSVDKRSDINASGDHLSMETYIGELQLELSYDGYDGALNVCVARARNLPQPSITSNKSAAPDCQSALSHFVKIHLLPVKSAKDKRRTMLSAPSINPEWHRTLVISDIAQQDLMEKTLEISVWSEVIREDKESKRTKSYIGEVLLDCSDFTLLDGRPHWYRLEENCSSNRYGQRPRTMSTSSSDSVASGSRSHHSVDKISDTDTNVKHTNQSQTSRVVIKYEESPPLDRSSKHGSTPKTGGQETTVAVGSVTTVGSVAAASRPMEKENDNTNHKLSFAASMQAPSKSGPEIVETALRTVGVASSESSNVPVSVEDSKMKFVKSDEGEAVSGVNEDNNCMHALLSGGGRSIEEKTCPSLQKQHSPAARGRASPSHSVNSDSLDDLFEEARVQMLGPSAAQPSPVVKSQPASVMRPPPRSQSHQSVIAASVQSTFTSLFCCFRPLATTSRQVTNPNGRTISRFLQRRRYSASTVEASSSFNFAPNNSSNTRRICLDQNGRTFSSSNTAALPTHAISITSATYPDPSAVRQLTVGKHHPATGGVPSCSASVSNDVTQASSLQAQSSLESESAVTSVPSEGSDDIYSLWLGPNERARCRLSSLGPGQILPTSIEPGYASQHDVISYYVIGDIIIGFQLDVNVRSLNVSVVQCLKIWDRLLSGVSQQKEWYVKLYLRSETDVSTIKKDKTTIQKCVDDPIFNEVFNYRTDCKSGYLEATLWLNRGLLSSNKAIGMALISLAQLPLADQRPNEQLLAEYRLLAERRSGE